MFKISMAYYMPEQHGLAQNGDSLYTEFIVNMVWLKTGIHCIQNLL
jgi:hypothetical protein